MRCICCNAALTDYESTIKHGITKEFVQLCSTCLRSIEAFIPVQVRNDLMTESDNDGVSLLDDDPDYIDDYECDDLDDYWDER
jgi:hypothetical protein